MPQNMQFLFNFECTFPLGQGTNATLFTLASYSGLTFAKHIFARKFLKACNFGLTLNAGQGTNATLIKHSMPTSFNSQQQQHLVLHGNKYKLAHDFFSLSGSKTDRLTWLPEPRSRLTVVRCIRLWYIFWLHLQTYANIATDCNCCEGRRPEL